MKKKLISLLLTCGMVIGTSTVAFAASNDGSAGTDVTASGAVEVAIIDVEIPTAIDFKIDPYNIGGQGEIATSVMTIENKSNVPVKIKMSKLKGTPGGNANLVASAPAADSTSNDVFLWVGAVTPTFDKTSGDITSCKAAAYSEAKNQKQVVTTTEATEAVDMGSLIQATYVDGSYDSTNAKGKMYLGIIGDVNTYAEDGWTADDSVSVTATFSVEPQVVGSVK